MGAEMRDQDNVPSRRWVIVAAAGLSLAMGGFINVVAFSQQGSTPPPAGSGGGAPQTATPGREQGAAPVQPAGAGRGGRAAAQVGTPVRGPDGEVWGYSDTAFNPGSRWRIHDPDRPQPPVVTPGETVSIPPPSDAIVLFGGKDLSAWVTRGREGGESPAAWAVRDGYFESSGGVVSTRESFGDVQLHLEFAMPVNAQGSSQGRGNGGIIFMGRYEIQLLDSVQQSHVRRRHGGVDLWRVAPTRQRGPEARRMAVTRHRVRGAALYRQARLRAISPCSGMAASYITVPS